MISLLSLSEIVNGKSKFQFVFLCFFSPPTNFVIFSTKNIGFPFANSNNFAHISENNLSNFQYHKRKNDEDILKI
jgi:hypothetical protein